MAGQAQPNQNLSDFLQTLDGFVSTQSGKVAPTSAQGRALAGISGSIDELRHELSQGGVGSMRAYLADATRNKLPAQMTAQLASSLDGIASGAISEGEGMRNVVSNGLKRDWAATFVSTGAARPASASPATPPPAAAPAAAPPAPAAPPPAAAAPAAPAAPPPPRSAKPADFFRELADEQAHLAAHAPDEAARKAAARSQATLAQLATLADNPKDTKGVAVRNFLSDPKARGGMQVDEELLKKLAPQYKGFMAGHISPDDMAAIAHKAMGTTPDAAKALRSGVAAAAAPVTPAAAPAAPAAPHAAAPAGPAAAMAGPAAKPPAGSATRSGLTESFSNMSLRKRGALVAGTAIVALAGLLGTGVVKVPESWKGPFSSAPAKPTPNGPNDAAQQSNARGADFNARAVRTKGQKFADRTGGEVFTKLYDNAFREKLGLNGDQAMKLATQLRKPETLATVINGIDSGEDSVPVRLPAGSILPDREVVVEYARDGISFRVGSGADAKKADFPTSTFAQKIYDGTDVAVKPGAKASGPAPG